MLQTLLIILGVILGGLGITKLLGKRDKKQEQAFLDKDKSLKEKEDLSEQELDELEEKLANVEKKVKNMTPGEVEEHWNKKK